MFHSPFFDPSKHSDDEILKMLNDLGKRMMVAQYTSTNQHMIDQLAGMMDALNEERAIRMAKQAQESWDKMFPDVIESDPEFKREKSDPSIQKATVVKPAQAQKKNLTNQIFHKEPYNKNTPTK